MNKNNIGFIESTSYQEDKCQEQEASKAHLFAIRNETCRDYREYFATDVVPYLVASQDGDGEVYRLDFFEDIIRDPDYTYVRYVDDLLVSTDKHFMNELEISECNKISHYSRTTKCSIIVPRSMLIRIIERLQKRLDDINDEDRSDDE